MANLFVLGDFNIDLVLYLDRLPNPGETLNANRFFEGPGGKGSNQAIAAARLGADVRFFGAIGDDYYGQVAVETWRANGVNTDYLIQNEAYQTAMALINVDANGNNTITVHQGANLRLTTADVDAATAADTALLDAREAQAEAHAAALIGAVNLAFAVGSLTSRESLP